MVTQLLHNHFLLILDRWNILNYVVAYFNKVNVQRNNI